jgi:hypothetical protein
MAIVIISQSIAIFASVFISFIIGKGGFADMGSEMLSKAGPMLLQH